MLGSIASVVESVVAQHVQAGTKRTSPVKQRIAATTLEYANITFVACANSRANMSKQESEPIDLITDAKVEPPGIVHLMELKGRGYAYLRP